MEKGLKMASSSQRSESELEAGARLEASLPANYRGDTVLPGQYYDIVGRRRWQDGEYRLAFAVLADAVACYRLISGTSKAARGECAFEEVRLWIYSHSQPMAFSPIATSLRDLGNRPRRVSAVA